MSCLYDNLHEVLWLPDNYKKSPRQRAGSSTVREDLTSYIEGVTYKLQSPLVLGVAPTSTSLIN